jgi:hypothetical protein
VRYVMECSANQVGKKVQVGVMGTYKVGFSDDVHVAGSLGSSSTSQAKAKVQAAVAVTQCSYYT